MNNYWEGLVDRRQGDLLGKDGREGWAWEGWEGVLAPAEEQKDEVGEEKSEDATDEVSTVGYKHCRASTKASGK